MNRFKQLGLALIAALLATAVIGAGALRRVDRWTQDWLFQRPGVPSGDIVIIGIDETAFDLLGPYNTWDRNIMASALEALAADPDNLPAAVAVDVLYAGNTAPEADERLARAAGALGNVVTGVMAEFGEKITWEDGKATALEADALIGIERPYEALRAVTVQGHINAMVDSDAVLRHALLYVDDGVQRFPSMALQSARLFAVANGRTLKVPDDSANHIYVPFTARPGAYYDGVSIAALIAGKVPSGYWANKIVFIGAYAPALQDAYFTPIDKGQQMYGVEFQANVVQSLLDGNAKLEIPELPQLIALFILCAAAAVLFGRFSVSRGGMVCAGLAALGLGGALLMYRLGWVTHPLWLPVGAAALYILSLAQHYARAARERRALALEKERLDTELSLAARIQANSLPKDIPERGEFAIPASMTPAKEVGGDLYDFFMIDDDHLALVIGDVSGKGVGASLFMMVCVSLIHHVAKGDLSPARVLETVNAEICARNHEEMFVTIWLGVLELSTGRLTAANAGHEYPALKRRDEPFQLLKDRHGFVLGGMEGIRYREYVLELNPGDKLFVYTDGVPEANNAAQEMFGGERMLDALRKGGEDAPAGVLEAVDRALADFVGDAPRFDDTTMLCLQYNGPSQEG